MTAEVGAKPDWLGRAIGLAVFCAGIVLLILVFVWTGKLGDQLPAAGEKVDWARWGIGFGVHIAQLFVSGLVASWIAGRGAQFYAAANRALSGG